MYAIFEDGGKQYKVSEGDTLLVERRDVAEGEKSIRFEQVLMLGEGGGAKIGQPFVQGAVVTATIEDEIKGPKIVGLKFKRRKRYLNRYGHRQKYLKVKIDGISG
ncbi:MAG: 50S ribosomal protein L21 [Phycisphaerales bacterium]|nr:50S ribosomal protein L21 [Phycisphaerales bacterium]